MKRQSKEKRLRGCFLAFLIVALAFLAVGLGTLGSLSSTGNAFELRAKREADTEDPGVVFYLHNPEDPEKEGSDLNLRVMGVYLNIANIYGKAGDYATLRVERGTGATSFPAGFNAVIENFEMPVSELDENGKPVTDIPEPDAEDAFFRYVSPFPFTGSGWRVSSYHYVRLRVNGAGPNVLLNEVVFYGEAMDSSNEGLGTYYIVPAEVRSATPYANEKAEDARLRATALTDGSANYSDEFFRHFNADEEGYALTARPFSLPTAESSFERYSPEEIASLMTVSEMRLGNTYAADKDGNPIDTYRVDGVWGALGEDFLALGTLMFGMSPFGLRFFPMLAAFGALVVLARLATRLTHSEKAGLVFAVLYALCSLTFGFGHLGTPAMIGVFFFACALDLVHRFYAQGMRKARLLSALPLFAAGLFGAAAIVINGAFVIPVFGVVVLFVFGMVRQQTAKRYQLEKVLAEAEETQTAQTEPVQAEGEETDTPARRAGKVLAGYRFRNTAAPVLFGAGLVFGTLLLALLGILPAYFPYLRAYDNPAAPTMNVFSLAWMTFAHGFTGVNAYVDAGTWPIFEILFRGTGEWYAVTALTVNPVALVAGGAGLVFTIVRIVLLCINRERDKAWRAEMRRSVILLAGTVLSVVAALAVKTGAVFALLALLFALLSFGCFFKDGKWSKPEKLIGIVGIVLLAAVFAVFAVFTFSVPLPASFLSAILG